MTRESAERGEGMWGRTYDQDVWILLEQLIIVVVGVGHGFFATYGERCCRSGA
jgi:hypothetical protein